MSDDFTARAITREELMAGKEAMLRECRTSDLDGRGLVEAMLRAVSDRHGFRGACS